MMENRPQVSPPSTDSSRYVSGRFGQFKVNGKGRVQVGQHRPVNGYAVVTLSLQFFKCFPVHGDPYYRGNKGDSSKARRNNLHGKGNPEFHAPVARQFMGADTPVVGFGNQSHDVQPQPEVRIRATFFTYRNQ